MQDTVSDVLIERVVGQEHDVKYIVDSQRLKHGIITCSCGTHTLVIFNHIEDELTKINHWIHRHRSDMAARLRTELGVRRITEDEASE